MTSPQPTPVGSSASDAQPDGKTISPPTAPIADGAASSIAPEASVQPVDHSATIDPESDQASQATSSDSDSTLGSVASFTTSLRSSVYDYPIENGLRYHAYQPSSGQGYAFPNDDVEQERLDIIHTMLQTLMDGKIAFAPVKDPKRILDCGTGTGIWSIEMADKYPAAVVIGNDISPIQPTYVPPNCQFEVDDVEKPWNYSSPFDYIHIRFMGVAISSWPDLLKQAYDNMEPGGWLELVDFDLDMASDDNTVEKTNIKKWMDIGRGGFKMIGRDKFSQPPNLGAASLMSVLQPSTGLYLEQWARAAGFVSVSHKMWKCPVGPWAKDRLLKQAGALNSLNLLEGLEGISTRMFLEVLRWSPNELKVLLAEVRRDIIDPRIHAYYTASYFSFPASLGNI